MKPQNKLVKMIEGITSTNDVIGEFPELTEQDWPGFLEYAVGKTKQEGNIHLDLLVEVREYIGEGFGTGSTDKGPGRASRLKLFEKLYESLFEIEVFTRTAQKTIVASDAALYEIVTPEQAINAFKIIEKIVRKPCCGGSADRVPTLQNLSLSALFPEKGSKLSELHKELVRLGQGYEKWDETKKSLNKRFWTFGSSDKRFEYAFLFWEPQRRERVERTLNTYGYIAHILSPRLLDETYRTLNEGYNALNPDRRIPRFGRFLHNIQTLIEYNEPGLTVKRSTAIAALHDAWWGYLEDMSGDIKTAFERYPKDPRICALEELRDHIGQYIKTLTDAYDYKSHTLNLATGYHLGGMDGAAELYSKREWDKPAAFALPIDTSQSDEIIQSIAENGITDSWEYREKKWLEMLASVDRNRELEIDSDDIYDDFPPFQKESLFVIHIKHSAYFLGNALQKEKGSNFVKSIDQGEPSQEQSIATEMVLANGKQVRTADVLEEYLQLWVNKSENRDVSRALAEKWIGYARGGIPEEELAEVYWAAVDFALIQKTGIEYDYKAKRMDQKKYIELKATITPLLAQLEGIYLQVPEPIRREAENKEKRLQAVVSQFASDDSDNKLLVKAYNASLRASNARELHPLRHALDGMYENLTSNRWVAREALNVAEQYMQNPEIAPSTYNIPDLKNFRSRIEDLSCSSHLENSNEQQFFRKIVNKMFNELSDLYSWITKEDSGLQFDVLRFDLHLLVLESSAEIRAKVLCAADRRMREEDMAFIVEMKEEPEQPKLREQWKHWEKLRKLYSRIAELREEFNSRPMVTHDGNDGDIDYNYPSDDENLYLDKHL